MICLGHRGPLGLFLHLQGNLGLNLWSGAAGHAALCMLRGMLLHLVRRCVRHHQVGLRSHRLLGMVGMMAIRRVSGLGLHGLVWRLRLVIHRLRHVLRRRLAIDASVLIMLRRRRDGSRGVRLGGMI